MGSRSVPIREITAGSAADLLVRAGRLVTEFGSTANADLVARAPAAAQDLDDDLRSHCRPPEADEGLFVLRGLNVDDDELGPTPQRWSEPGRPAAAVWDTALLLLASAMGRAFGWAGQQDGRPVHDIVPTPGHEREQTGASSGVLLSPHTEDAFHPRRAHLLMLGCLRNHDEVATHASSVRRTELSAADRETLSRPTLPILPDDSYSAGEAFCGDAPSIPTLWDREDGLCVRFDPAYTPLNRADRAFRDAYARLGTELERVTEPVRLRPGDVLVIDNDVIVHGREPFRARYDGTDRWLKRINVRIPGRGRPAGEAVEHGYGQQVVDPHA